MAMRDEMTVLPGARSGCVKAPPSKSALHRLLICAALGGEKKRILCEELSEDILATARCLRALGAEVTMADSCIEVLPLQKGREDSPEHASPALLPCGESGSTLRFLLPVCGALGRDAAFTMEGRLPERPLSPLTECLRTHGMQIKQPGSTLRCGGMLNPGRYEITGEVSSQFISGLLFALPLPGGQSELVISGRAKSSPYIEMTLEALREAGIAFTRAGNTITVPGGQRYALPAETAAEGDWSNSALFLCMGALSRKGITVTGLPQSTRQGDREIMSILRRFGAEVTETPGGITVKRGEARPFTVDASATPDLVPALAVLACGAAGESRITNAARLRMKESDRLAECVKLIRALGGNAEETEDGMIIRGSAALHGGRAENAADHRIVMAAALAASLCEKEVILSAPECVRKSFPGFWSCLGQLEIVSDNNK